MKLDLLSLVGDGIDARPVHTLGQEIALGVVAAEEGIQVVVDLGLKRIQVHRVLCEPGAQLLDLGECVRIGTQRARLLDRLRQILLDRHLVCGLVLREGRLHLRQEVSFQELAYVGALGMHHAVEAEVQIG